jgi:hypothetical protein
MLKKSPTITLRSIPRENPESFIASWRISRLALPSLPVGIRSIKSWEWLKMAYNTDGENLDEAIQIQSGCRGISAQLSLFHRYFTEDIPISPVPTASPGNQHGVSVRSMESKICLA